MWILTQEGKRIIPNDTVSRISMVQKGPEVRVLAWLRGGEVQGKYGLTYHGLGRYTPLEARDCFEALLAALERGDRVFRMPDSDVYEFDSPDELREAVEK